MQRTHYKIISQLYHWHKHITYQEQCYGYSWNTQLIQVMLRMLASMLQCWTKHHQKSFILMLNANVGKQLKMQSVVARNNAHVPVMQQQKIAYNENTSSPFKSHSTTSTSTDKNFQWYQLKFGGRTMNKNTEQHTGKASPSWYSSVTASSMSVTSDDCQLVRVCVTTLWITLMIISLSCQRWT